MSTPVPTTLVSRNTAGPSIERSTWLSAAKWTTTSCPAISRVDHLASRMSPCTNGGVESPSSSSTVALTPAYVSRSRLVTSASGSRSSTRRMKFEPMKPAPPVTRYRRVTTHELVRNICPPGGSLIAVGHDGLGDRPFDFQVGIVPAHPELIASVVVARDQVRHQGLAFRIEAMGDADRNVDGVRAGELKLLDLQIGGGRGSQIDEGDDRVARGNEPEVLLAQVVVEAARARRHRIWRCCPARRCCGSHDAR